jgi:hypothetical protein
MLEWPNYCTRINSVQLSSNGSLTERKFHAIRHDNSTCTADHLAIRGVKRKVLVLHWKECWLCVTGRMSCEIQAVQMRNGMYTLLHSYTQCAKQGHWKSNIGRAPSEVEATATPTSDQQLVKINSDTIYRISVFCLHSNFMRVPSRKTRRNTEDKWHKASKLSGHM